MSPRESPCGKCRSKRQSCVWGSSEGGLKCVWDVKLIQGQPVNRSTLGCRPKTSSDRNVTRYPVILSNLKPSLTFFWRLSGYLEGHRKHGQIWSNMVHTTAGEKRTKVHGYGWDLPIENWRNVGHLETSGNDLVRIICYIILEFNIFNSICRWQKQKVYHITTTLPEIFSTTRGGNKKKSTQDLDSYYKCGFILVLRCFEHP